MLWVTAPRWKKTRSRPSPTLKPTEAALTNVLEMNPNFSQAHLKQTYPEAILRFKKGLALAGLS